MTGPAKRARALASRSTKKRGAETGEKSLPYRKLSFFARASDERPSPRRAHHNSLAMMFLTISAGSIPSVRSAGFSVSVPTNTSVGRP